MGKLANQTDPRVAELCQWCLSRKLRGSTEQLEALLRYMDWDVDFAQIAMVLLPRPQWVADIVGAQMNP